MWGAKEKLVMHVALISMNEIAATLKAHISETQSDLANDTLSQIREGERWVS